MVVQRRPQQIHIAGHILPTILEIRNYRVFKIEANLQFANFMVMQPAVCQGLLLPPFQMLRRPWDEVDEPIT